MTAVMYSCKCFVCDHETLTKAITAIISESVLIINNRKVAHRFQSKASSIIAAQLN